MKLKSTCTAKETQTAPAWETSLASYTSGRANAQNLQRTAETKHQSINLSANKWAAETNSFQKKKHNWPVITLKTVPIPGIRGMQVKTTFRYYLTLVRLSSRNLTANIGEDVGEENPLFIAVQISAAIKKISLEGLCDPAILLQACATEVFAHPCLLLL